jgi:hypothetical protein
MKHAVEMSTGAMIHIPRFLKTGSVFQKLTGVGIYIHADCMETV